VARAGSPGTHQEDAVPDDEVPQRDRHRAFSDEREPPQLPPSAWAPRPGDPVEHPSWQTARRHRSSARRGWWWAAGAFVALGMCTAGNSGTDHGAYGGGAGMGDVQCDADASGNIVQDSPECRELARTMGGASVDDGTGRPPVVDPATVVQAVPSSGASISTVIVAEGSVAATPVDIEVMEGGQRRTQQVTLPYTERIGSASEPATLTRSQGSVTARVDVSQWAGLSAGDVLQCQVRVDGALVSLQTAAVSDGPGELLAVTCTVPLSRAR
jgi:hypothetical protein